MQILQSITIVEKLLWIVYIVIIMAFLPGAAIVEAHQVVKFEGYCKAEYKLSSNRRVYAWKSSQSWLASSPNAQRLRKPRLPDELRIKWMFNQDVSNATHIRFQDVQVTNLASEEPLLDSAISSPEIQVLKRSITPMEETSVVFKGGTWRIKEDDLMFRKMQDFVDYRISGTAVEFNGKHETHRESFEIYLMRDFKAIPASDLPDNWTAGPSFLITQEKQSLAKLVTGVYSTDLQRIVTVFNFGNLSLENGEIFFKEVDAKRKAFFKETVNERYEWVNGELKRLWELEKRNVDAKPYGYLSIYQRGYPRK